ncbi:Serine/threonine-protein phosphatase CPPED1 [Varanus komodoensis]|nr:Serine/threonine-protein phosphatase CPPED1 [Varanus komodoensis]
MAEEKRGALLKARDRTLGVFREDAEQEWKAPFYFIQGADPQFGLMKAYAIGDCSSGGDEWGEELRLTQQAVRAINQLNPRPKFLVLCGDLIHGMPVGRHVKPANQNEVLPWISIEAVPYPSDGKNLVGSRSYDKPTDLEELQIDLDCSEFEHIMRKARLDESKVGIKIGGRNINNLRYADDTTLMAKSEEELKSLLMRVKEESAKVGLKLNIKKTKIMASGPLTSWQIDGEEMEVVTDFIFLGSKITIDGTPWREAQTRDLKDALSGVHHDIPLVFVSGNHDLGNTPTPETIEHFCQEWGDDYFSFWVGGIFFLVLNSQLYFDASKCPELKTAQDAWLSHQLAIATERKCKHVIVFQHIPLFLKDPNEDHDYFNLEESIRHELLEKFHKAGTLSLCFFLVIVMCHQVVFDLW